MVPEVPDSAVDLARRVAELEAENRRLRQLLGFDGRPSVAPTWEPTLFTGQAEAAGRKVNRRSPPEEKVALFPALFRGHDDVYALRWENARTGRSGWSPAVKGGWVNARKPDREHLPLNDQVVSDHLGGVHHAGLYPLLDDDSCQLLACDFDGPGWALDALSYLDAARAAGVPAVLERSRSGDGGHAWVFFAASVPATSARRVGVFLVREAMTVRAELDLSSYDRLFPLRTSCPARGSAISSAYRCRESVAEGERPYSWTREPRAVRGSMGVPFIACPMSAQAVTALADSIGDLAVGPVSRTYRRPAQSKTHRLPPNPIRVHGSQLVDRQHRAIDGSGRSVESAASLANPEFYEKERNRFWTGKTPRLIRCYREELGLLRSPSRAAPSGGGDRGRGGHPARNHRAPPRRGGGRFDLAVELRPDQRTR